MGSVQTQAKAFTQTTNKGYYLQTMEQSVSLTTGSGAADDALASVALDSSVYKIMGKKAVVAIDIRTAYLNVAANFSLQVSMDGLNWTADLVTMSADIEPDSTGISTFIADLTDIDAPYWRLVFNSGLLTVGASGLLSFSFAYTK